MVWGGVDPQQREDLTSVLVFFFTWPEPPPTPTITIQCNDSCTLNCTADTKDLELTYEWKEDEGEWTKGDKLKNISSDTTKQFFCRLRTRVRPSITSMPMANPLYKPVPGMSTLKGLMKVNCAETLICRIGFGKFTLNLYYEMWNALEIHTHTHTHTHACQSVESAHLDFCNQ